MSPSEVLQLFDELAGFLKEMAQLVPYDQRRFKGSVARQAEAERLLNRMKQGEKP